VTITLLILGLLLAFVGLVGCILPVIPGPPISFLSLIVLSYARHWEPFSTTFLVVMGVIASIVVLLDYIIPAGGARRYGASKAGVAGSMIGMFVGFFFVPPFGIFIGAFLGAIIGELVIRKGGKEALRAGWGVFVGFVVSTGIKMAFACVVLFFYITELF
jgi:uncharacterized protein YqgC (DUF456 family)